MNVSEGGVDSGGGGEGGTERFREGVVGGGNGLDFASRALVEDVTVAGFIVSDGYSECGGQHHVMVLFGPDEMKDLLWFVPSEHVESLTLVSSAKKGRVAALFLL